MSPKTWRIAILVGLYGAFTVWIAFGTFRASLPVYPDQFAGGQYEIGPLAQCDHFTAMDMCWRLSRYCLSGESTWTLYVFSPAETHDTECYLAIAVDGQNIVLFRIAGLQVKHVNGSVPPAFRSKPPPGQLAAR